MQYLQVYHTDVTVCFYSGFKGPFSGISKKNILWHPEVSENIFHECEGTQWRV